MSALETLLAQAQGGAMTAKKAAKCMEGAGMYVSGVVLCNAAGVRCIVEMGAALAISKDEMNKLMHRPKPTNTNQ